MAPQLVEGAFRRLGQHPHDDVAAGLEPVQLSAQQVTEPAADSVAGHRGADRSGDDEPGPRPARCPVGRSSDVQVNHETVARGAATAPDDGGKVVSPP